MNKVKLIMEMILKSFAEKNFKVFLKSLLTLKELVIKEDPEKFDPGLVDLVMDENMWDWAASVLDREPSDHDWTAAEYIALDVREILKSINEKEEI